MRTLTLLAAVLLLQGCDDASGPAAFQGYVEGDLRLVGADEAGRVERLAVGEGDRIAKGSALFSLDQALHEAQWVEAQARVQEAVANLADLRDEQQRPAEIEVLQARRRQAEAELGRSRHELDRQADLFRRGVTARARLDEAEAAQRRALAAVQEIAEQIESGQMAARWQRIVAARAAVEARQAALAQADERLRRRTVTAPADGVVQTLFFAEGEVTAAGQPVLALLPDSGRKVRFFVPEPSRASLRLGQPVTVGCDGCPAGLAAKIAFIAPSVEYTPPVIFGPGERAKLVTMVEARPEGDAAALAPGQPVTVMLQAGTPR